MKLQTICFAGLLATAAATSALAAAPDPVNSTATTPGGGVMSCPAGDGNSLLTSGTPVFINLIDALGVPCAGFSAGQISLRDLNGRIFECGTGPGTHPLNGTDINGDTQIDGPLGAGGWTLSGLQVFIGSGPSSFPLAGPLLPIDHNSPDITGDGLVDLADINLAGVDFSSVYSFRSDLNHDGTNDISDLATFIAHECHSCGFFVPLSAVTARGSIGIFFDTDGPPYTERTLSLPPGNPFSFYVVAEGIGGMSAIDAPLRLSSGVVILSLTPTGGFGNDPILYGTTCFDATPQTVIAQGQALVVAIEQQAISFASPATACNGMPAAAYVPCNAVPKAPPLGGGFDKVQVSSRGIINGVLNVADPLNTTVNTPVDCCIMACPAGDGDTFTDAACTLTVTAVDGTGNPVIGLNGSDFELDGVVPAEIADCQYQTPGFVESPPGTYAFTQRLSAGGQTQNGLQVRVQGGTPMATGAGTITVVSPDITGDGVVDLADVGDFAMDINDTPPTTDDWRSDFDCSGMDLPLDVGRLAQHYAHGNCILDPVDKLPSPNGARIYLSLETTGRSGSLQIAAKTSFRFHVLAEGVESLTAWEARVSLPPEVVVTRRILVGEHAVNLMSGTDEWIVGLGECQPAKSNAPVVLATYEAILARPLETDAVISITALESGRSSLAGQHPAWVSCAAAEVAALDTQDSSILLTGKPGREDPTVVIPTRTELLGAAPNPFNPTTTIRFRMRTTGNAVLSIFDLAGRRIRTEVLQAVGAGDHEFRWNGQDDRGVVVASGTYVVRLETADGTDVRRVALLK